MKKVLLFSVVSLLLLLTSCHPCDERDLSDEALEMYAEEYGLSNYIVEYTSWDEAEAVYEYTTNLQCQNIPEHSGKKLVEHRDGYLKILYLTGCSEDEIAYFEGVYPTLQDIKQAVDRYNINNTTSIEVVPEDFEWERYGIYYYFFYDYDFTSDIITYYVGTLSVMLDEETEYKYGVYVVQVEDVFVLVREVYNQDLGEYEVEILEEITMK